MSATAVASPGVEICEGVLPEDTVLVRITGELDIATAPAAEAAIDTVAARGRPVGLDLSGVTFADAAGFHMVLCACVLPRDDADVHVIASSPAVHRLCELALEAMAEPR